VAGEAGQDIEVAADSSTGAGGRWRRATSSRLYPRREENEEVIPGTSGNWEWVWEIGKGFGKLGKGLGNWEMILGNWEMILGNWEMILGNWENL
jgi:hypothetical protein